MIVFMARYRLKAGVLPVYALLIPFVYYWLTFYLGFDALYVPQGGSGGYWNTRFAVQAVPAAAFFVAI